MQHTVQRLFFSSFFHRFLLCGRTTRGNGWFGWGSSRRWSGFGFCLLARSWSSLCPVGDSVPLSEVAGMDGVDVVWVRGLFSSLVGTEVAAGCCKSGENIQSRFS